MTTRRSDYRVMVFETDGGGHRLTYVRHAVRALEALDGVTPVIALGRGARENDAFEHQAGELVKHHGVIEVEYARRGGPLRTAIARRNELLRTIARADIDHVLLPSGDGIAQFLALPGSGAARRVPVEAVLHRAPFAYTGEARTRGATLNLAALARAPIDRAHFVDVLGLEWLIERNHPLATRSVALGDPVDPAPSIDKHTARAAFGLKNARRLLVSTGVQDRRKGVNLLGEAWAHTRRQGALQPGDKLLLAGRVGEGIAPVIEQARADTDLAPDLHVIGRYISNEELDNAFAAADVVVTAHPSHVGLSNVTLRAFSARRPVISSDYGWLGRIVPGFGLGWSCPVRDTEAFARTLAAGLDGAATWTPPPQALRLEQFHSLENFNLGLTALVRERLGLGGEPPLSWADVASSASPLPAPQPIGA